MILSSRFVSDFTYENQSQNFEISLNSIRKIIEIWVRVCFGIRSLPDTIFCFQKYVLESVLAASYAVVKASRGVLGPLLGNKGLRALDTRVQENKLWWMPFIAPPWPEPNIGGKSTGNLRKICGKSAENQQNIWEKRGTSAGNRRKIGGTPAENLPKIGPPYTQAVG